MPLISVVDDDPSVRRALGRLIRSADYDVETFASAREFLDWSPVGRIACLVLDIRLDCGMSGFDLQERLATDQAAIPIIFITAHDDARTRHRVDQAGVAAYLVKPFEALVLLDAIRSVAGTPDQDQRGAVAEMSEHRGWRIALAVNERKSRWRVLVEVWKPGPDDQLSTLHFYTRDFATADEARGAGHCHAVKWIDSKKGHAKPLS